MSDAACWNADVRAAGTLDALTPILPAFSISEPLPAPHSFICSIGVSESADVAGIHIRFDFSRSVTARSIHIRAGPGWQSLRHKALNP